MKKKNKMKSAVDYGEFKYPGTTTRSNSRTRVPEYKRMNATK